MSTFERLQRLLEDDGLDRARLVQEATLDSLEIDSLRMIEIFFRVEDELGISVPAEPSEIAARVKTLGDLADYLDSLEAGKAAT